MACSNSTVSARRTSSHPRRHGYGLTGIVATTIAAALLVTVGSPGTSSASQAPLAPAVTAVAGQAGSFPMLFQNNTGGRWSNSQIYVTMLGQTAPGQWSYVKPDGNAVHIDHAEADASGHLTKEGVNYPNMSFNLAQLTNATMEVPADFQGGRAFVSLGSPMYIAVSPDNKGWAGPDPNNPRDPNSDVYYDWYEFTYRYGQVHYGGNPTQVDMFGFPITARVQQSSTNFNQLQGISLSRADVYDRYKQQVGNAFQPLEETYRILSPRTSKTFGPDGNEANYFTGAINRTWAYYSTHPFTLGLPGEDFQGTVRGDQLDFTLNGKTPSHLNKPTSTDVAQCSGTLARSGMSVVELRLGALFCAAFNRGVAMDTSQWSAPADYYTSGVYNDYAKFYHSVSVNGLAYGFAYDDIFDQSSVSILPNNNPPSQVTIGVGW
jgi:hypothetical protein